MRLDVPWRIRIVSERGPELLDGVIHPLLEVDVDVGSPELLVNRLSRDELARVRYEDPQQLEGLWSEPDRALSFAELKGGWVEVEGAESNEPVVTQAAIVCLRAERAPVYHHGRRPRADDARNSPSYSRLAVHLQEPSETHLLHIAPVSRYRYFAAPHRGQADARSIAAPRLGPTRERSRASRQRATRPQEAEMKRVSIIACACLIWAGPARADVVVDWNQVRCTGHRRGCASRPSRAYSTSPWSTLAMHDAIQALRGTVRAILRGDPERLRFADRGCGHGRA